MALDVWKTLYTNDFDTDHYLYHYSTFDKAIKIMQSNSLRFSPINKTNDTVEAKVRISFPHTSQVNKAEFDKKTAVIYDYFCKHHPEIRLLCFSTDNQCAPLALPSPSKRVFYDISGRGFALPRMWSQYASNNEGVCFIFNKEKLLEEVQKSIAFHRCEKVRYKKYTDSFNISEEKVDSLYSKVSMLANGSLTLVEMMQKDKEFLQYNYFQKLDDWKNEREFRIIALAGDNSSALSIGNLFSYLEGVVIGEYMDSAYEEVIKLIMAKNKEECEVKRIVFSGQICKVK